MIAETTDYRGHEAASFPNHVLVTDRGIVFKPQDRNLVHTQGGAVGNQSNAQARFYEANDCVVVRHFK